jgi:hypothetical protein
MHRDHIVSAGGRDRIRWSADVIHARGGRLGHVDVLVADRDRRGSGQRNGVLCDAIGNGAVTLPFLAGGDFEPRRL